MSARGQAQSLPRRKWLARRNSHASLACRTSSSPPKLKIFGGPAYYGYLCGPPMMSKTVLDLLHTLGVEDDMIMFDDLWQLPQIKPPSVVGVQGLRYWIA